MPASWYITGIEEFADTKSTRPFPPLGIMTSTYSFSLKSAAIASLSLKFMVSTAPSGRPAEINASLISLPRIMLELNESEPPRNIKLLPDLIDNEAASLQTFGLDSNIMPMTPSGILTLLTVIPFGLFFLDVTTPTGSFNLITSLKDIIIVSMYLSSSFILSRKGAGSPFFRPASISFWFSAFMACLLASKASAIALSALFL